MKSILLGSVGFLADTAALRAQAFRDAFREHGLIFQASSPAYIERLAGLATPNGLSRNVDVGSVLNARNHFFSKALSDGPLRPHPGLKGLITAANEGNVALGIVVTTPSSWLQAVFKGLSLSPEIFDTIVTADHVTAPKPAPDAFYLASAMLATAPEDCLAIEDTPAGVSAARATGMQVMDLSVLAPTKPDPLGALCQRLGEQRAARV
ncbi:hypothetical protein JANAI62_06810 [Jannaschia pagri]|uniref:Haloacid dehalogenase superfamily, subfamily IA, variant 3 with third motif having DD or ED n=1 Tax=Jannaschia pagri TaxID=2829797 RepID=A0ABQ4NI11_9RHOB|nr:MULTISPECIES: HAD family phosphatase [unclassified Jannaschia]GIT89835.1 hypothetical protein JANAI61_02930 [Jannaschia sp. AI_61]GIT94058.1 hypothetical protein JANAI62_06810 [Jannaschia sp. AI_62]